jgi:hypothetical protein
MFSTNGASVGWHREDAVTSITTLSVTASLSHVPFPACMPRVTLALRHIPANRALPALPLPFHPSRLKKAHPARSHHAAPVM